MIKEREKFKKGRTYYLTTDGNVISNYDIANIIYIVGGERVSPYEFATIESYASKCKGIIKELDPEEAMDIIDEKTSRTGEGGMKINGGRF